MNLVDYVTTRVERIKEWPRRTFLYKGAAPTPQVSSDHPFGQAAVVANIPQQESDDWKEYVAAYYFWNFGPYYFQARAFAGQRWIETRCAGYAEVDDDLFRQLISEGLYSKFLCEGLDQEDEDRFASVIDGGARDEYWKSDYSCMERVQQPIPGAFLAPTVVLLRRRKDRKAFEVVAIALARFAAERHEYVWLDDPVVPGATEAWRLAKYFALQGAIHRINLIDHTRVHFPHDAINAATKTLLPVENLVFQLLEPHLWLTLPVNNAVLEGERSLINRTVRQPYTPFAADGTEIRKLFPFGWFGATYYDHPNRAFPAYAFQLEPPRNPSRYGQYLNAYHEPIRQFVRDVLAELPDDDEHHTDWIEIQRWAEHISTWVPGFPYWKDFVFEDARGRADATELLAETVAMIIHNASVVHSADHAALHAMMEKHPVPFVLRVKPPEHGDQLREREQEEGLADACARLLRFVDRFDGSSGVAQAISAVLADDLTERLFPDRLCDIDDLTAARYADLLFYLPHNSSLLIDCAYRFNVQGDPRQRHVKKFQAALRSVSADPEIGGIVRDLDLPLLEDPAMPMGESRTTWTGPFVKDPKKRTLVERSQCIAASIQY
ncbi:MAG TPA: hypothetical protein VEC57_13905 [Candidatus Limnocylindrales bacterium]|nr:hypothetical protein [Candidatus Limnocylindrales bacterium]